MSSSSFAFLFPYSSLVSFAANICFTLPSNIVSKSHPKRALQESGSRCCCICCSKASSCNECQAHGTRLSAPFDIKIFNKPLTMGRRMIIGTSLPFFLLPDTKTGVKLFGISMAKATEKELDLGRIQEELNKVITKAKAAGILRLVFHDAGTFDQTTNSGGMNGSIIYELERPESTGLKRSVKVLERAKACLDPALQVSWADLIAVAGAQAVAVCGGPEISVKLGRFDSSLPDPEGQLPEESLHANALKQCFERKSFSTQELVVLSGAHTLGSKGFGEPTSFDNSYFKTLLRKPWLTSEDSMTAMIGLPSDRALVEDSECKKWLEVYAYNQEIFFKDFSLAYLKLINLGAKWKSGYL